MTRVILTATRTSRATRVISSRALTIPFMIIVSTVRVLIVSTTISACITLTFTVAVAVSITTDHDVGLYRDCHCDHVSSRGLVDSADDRTGLAVRDLERSSENDFAECSLSWCRKVTALLKKPVDGRQSRSAGCGDLEDRV